ncbi:AT-rich interactive domain-containing protein 4B-like isoform X2 [Anneissia japonica]|uniref:AT-rich interactive domain-containing protein 4B-like isoform X2 n=1 Tax=Anneissia japonica TaxID=1529436 RepID=UPI0014259CA2|nr:AT-rich interactive domain-containing protein 4B-like isoform X2 [Anneissia japonica]
MDRDCPAYLTVGTDVSAKYRGAFCEAKVKTASKHVKCKISFKGFSSAIVSDEFVNGQLKIGAAVHAKHPEQGTYQEGVILKLTDASTYTVVFDDGDEKTLRRSSLCLQGERHFNESETLDHLPLTDPENFGTPVVRDAKKRKKRKPSIRSLESDDEESRSGVSTSAKKRTSKDRGSEDIGKVVIVDINEKRKNSWFPALVVHPKRTKEVTSKNNNLIVKSFRDNKIHNIAKNSTKAFTTKDHVYKGDNNSLRAAVNKAVSYIETGNLPTNWDSSIIKEEDFLFESDEDIDSEDESDDDFDVETDAWLASLYKFMEERGTPINKPPVLGYQDLNLFKLYKLVQDMGGCRKVTDHQKWREISFKMGIPVINSSSHHNIKGSYIKYLHAFEEYNRKLGPGLPGPLTRTTRRRSSFERPTLSPIRPRMSRMADEDGESDNEREPPMLKRRGTIAELDETEDVNEKPAKKSDRQNKKDDKQKAKDVKKEELYKDEDPEEVVEKPGKSKGNEHKPESKVKNKDSVKAEAKDKQIPHVNDIENQTQETDTDYQLGEKIKVLYGRGRTQKVYEAKIIEIDVEAHWQRMYRVHYVGWNIRHDEWIGNNRIVGSDERVKLRKKQKQDKEKEKEKKLKEKEKKEREEKERLQREEKERIQKEQEKLLKEKKEKEKQEKERLDKERIKKEKEKLEKERKEKNEREAREKERLEKEQEKLEKERKRKEKEKAEQEKKEKEEERQRQKEVEIAESLESKKKEKKDERPKAKSKTKTKEDPEVLSTEKSDKEDQTEKGDVERPKTPGKRGRPSLKSNTSPAISRSNSTTRKVPSPVSSKSTRTRRSDRNSLSDSPFAAGLEVKPRTRRSSIHSDTKLKQEEDSESESSNSVKDEEEKTEETKEPEEEEEEAPAKEIEVTEMQVDEKEEQEVKQVKNEPIEEKVEIKEEILPIEVPVVEEAVLPEQKEVEEPVEVTAPKAKEKKREKKDGKTRKKKEGKGKKDKKDQIIEQSEDNVSTTAQLESNIINQNSVENVKEIKEEEKKVMNKLENEEERPKKDSKSEGKKSRKRRRSKSSLDRKLKASTEVESKDKENDVEAKRLSISINCSKEEAGAAALMDIYNPSQSASAQEKLESMAQTSKSLTPPTTPENSPPNPSSPADQSMDIDMRQEEPSNRSDSDGVIDVASVTDVQPIGNHSPHCDASISSNTSVDSSMNGIGQEKRSGSSKKRRRTISEGDTPSKRKRRSHKHSSHHEKKKRHSKEPIRHSSSDTDDTTNNDLKATAQKIPVSKTAEQNGKPVQRPGRTPKYNFRVDLSNVHDQEERIAIIQHQLNEMRKIYLSLKNEVASIDRRRKKLRRKEREGRGKVAAAATISSDRRTSDRHGNDTS